MLPRSENGVKVVHQKHPPELVRYLIPILDLYEFSCHLGRNEVQSAP